MNFDKKKYDQNYAKEKLKRIPLDLPKCEYEAMKENMKAKGETKVNTYIRKLIAKDIQLPD